MLYAPLMVNITHENKHIKSQKAIIYTHPSKNTTKVPLRSVSENAYLAAWNRNTIIHIFLIASSKRFFTNHYRFFLGVLIVVKN